MTDLRDDDTATDPRDLALAAAEHAIAKKARDLLLLDMRGLVTYTDYWVICTGQTPRQTKAIAEEVRRKLREDRNLRPRRIEGDKEGEWILLDFLDIIVHVFTPEARDFYRLELLWRRAPQERVDDEHVPVDGGELSTTAVTYESVPADFEPIGADDLAPVEAAAGEAV